jgi:hypothetical protein
VAGTSRRCAWVLVRDGAAKRADGSSDFRPPGKVSRPAGHGLRLASRPPQWAECVAIPIAEEAEKGRRQSPKPGDPRINGRRPTGEPNHRHRRPLQWVFEVWRCMLQIRSSRAAHSTTPSSDATVVEQSSGRGKPLEAHGQRSSPSDHAVQQLCSSGADPGTRCCWRRRRFPRETSSFGRYMAVPRAKISQERQCYGAREERVQPGRWRAIRCRSTRCGPCMRLGIGLVVLCLPPVPPLCA